MESPVGLPPGMPFVSPPITYSRAASMEGERTPLMATNAGKIVVHDSGSGFKSTGIACGRRGICDTCKIGVVRNELSWPWVILATVLFPFGLVFVCCIRRRCAVCGLHF